MKITYCICIGSFIPKLKMRLGSYHIAGSIIICPMLGTKCVQRSMTMLQLPVNNYHSCRSMDLYSWRRKRNCWSSHWLHHKKVTWLLEALQLASECLKKYYENLKLSDPHDQWFYLSLSSYEPVTTFDNMKFVKTHSLIYTPFHKDACYINFEVR